MWLSLFAEVEDGLLGRTQYCAKERVGEGRPGIVIVIITVVIVIVVITVVISIIIVIIKWPQYCEGPHC